MNTLTVMPITPVVSRIEATEKIKSDVERYIRLTKREKKTVKAKDRAKNNILKFCNFAPAVIVFGREQIAKVIEKEVLTFDIQGLEQINAEMAKRFTKKNVRLEIK